MSNKIRVVFYGLGEMGRAIAAATLRRKGIEAVGAVDVAKGIVGRDLGAVAGMGPVGVTVSGDAQDLLSRVGADIVLHATVSRLPEALPQLAECLRAGSNVISTCEELSYPYHKYPHLAAELDHLAKSNGAALLGTGINPGYLMDALPLMLTGPCQEVTSITVTRMMNSAKRRLPFQKKVGEGLTLEEFAKAIESGAITGHVGLVESIAMIGSSIGWELDEVRELPPEPVVAEKAIETSYTLIQPGTVAGLRSVAYGAKAGQRLITLEFVAHAGVAEEYDAVDVAGVPSIHQRILGGVHGDLGTAGVVVNMIPRVLKAQAGLLTMMDLPPVSAINADPRSHLNWRTRGQRSLR